MPEETTHVQDGPDSTFPADPMAEILREDAEARRNELETVLSKKATTQQEAAETVDEPTEKKDSTSSKRAGIDTVLRKVRENPNATLTTEEAEAIRAQQATITRLQQERKDLESRMDDAVRAAVQEALGETAQEEELPLTDDQEALFKKLLQKYGVVLKDELEQMDQQKTATTYRDESNRRAAEAYGDGFGAFDEEGNFVLSDESREELAPVYQRLQDSARGVTYEDLYILKHHEDLVNAAYEKGLSERAQQNGQRRERLVRAQTESGGASLTPAPRIRGPKGSSEDTRDKVMQRAFLLAKRKLASARS